MGTSEWIPETHLEAVMNGELGKGTTHLNIDVKTTDTVLQNALALSATEPWFKTIEKENKKEYSLDFKFNDGTTLNILLAKV